VALLWLAATGEEELACVAPILPEIVFDFRLDVCGQLELY